MHSTLQTKSNFIENNYFLVRISTYIIPNVFFPKKKTFGQNAFLTTVPKSSIDSWN